MYNHFLCGIPDVPESTARNLWKRKSFTSNLFERQTTLDIFFKKKQHFRTDFLTLTMATGESSVYQKVCVFSVF
jgi:hypothetical protein